jgi:hypothetical protein
MRVGVALVLLLDLFLRSQDLVAFYSDDGVLPRVALDTIKKPWEVSIHALSGAWQIEVLLFIFAGIIAIMLLVGLFTRFATVVSWFLLLSLIHRNPLVLVSGDYIVLLTLFWGILLPWGSRFSLDRLIGRSVREGPDIYQGAAVVGYFLQVAVVYWSTALWKSTPEWRYEGTAIEYVLSNPNFRTDIGMVLLNVPVLLQYATKITLIVEGLVPCLLFMPVATQRFRLLAVTILVCLQIAFGTTIAGLGLFPLQSIVALLGLLPSCLWNAMEQAGPVRKLYGVRDALYRWLSRRHVVTLQKYVRGLHQEYQPAYIDRCGRIIGACWLACGVVGNFGALPMIPVLHWQPRLPETAQSVSHLLGTDLSWSMFCCPKLRVARWLVLPGTFANGEQVDLYRSGQALTWHEPRDWAKVHRNYRWQAYVTGKLESTGRPELWTHFLLYVCHRWNRAHDAAHEVQELHIVYVQQTAAGAKQTWLWSEFCSEAVRRPLRPEIGRLAVTRQTRTYGSD